ncbi:MAG: ABC transporter permease, partial [bacterium]
MFKNYLKVAVRNLRKYKTYSFINISGLAIGMACCILSLLFVQQELSYDKFHENAGQIYRVTTKLSNPVAGWEAHYAATSFPVAPALKRDYPEVTNAVRIYKSDRSLVGYEEKRFYEDRFFFADSTIFAVFSFPLLKGNPRMALKEPFSVVITEEIAKKYFGDDDPVGMALVLDNQHTFKVTGILKNLPRNSQLQFEFLASYITLNDIIGKDKLETGWFM